MNYTQHCESPLGGMTMASDGEGLTGLWFDGQVYFGTALGKDPVRADLPVFQQTVSWLDLYFKGKKPDFMPLLHPAGSAFRQMVWNVLLTIPYGSTITYGEIAERIAHQKGMAGMSAQAVGGAVGHNPISIIIPCHRVLGADGGLTGYAGGINKKRQLLLLEGGILQNQTRQTV